MFDVTAIGELLIDFTPCGADARGNALFARNPGGAPANLLAMLSKLGRKTAFIGKVGRDAFGEFLKQTLDRAGIDTGNLILTDACNTTLAFVQLDPSGDRSFTFYRRPGADVLLEASEVGRRYLDNTRIFHFGSVSLTDEPSRTATLSAARRAKQAGKIISYDPNYRPALWPDIQAAGREMRRALEFADIVKVSDDEAALLTGEADFGAGARKLLLGGAALIFVTCGAKGAYFYTGRAEGFVPAFSVNAVDATGAGDAFLGAALYGLLDKTLPEITALDEGALTKIVRFANAAAGLTATGYGAIPALPDLEQINRLFGA